MTNKFKAKFYHGEFEKNIEPLFGSCICKPGMSIYSVFFVNLQHRTIKLSIRTLILPQKQSVSSMAGGGPRSEMMEIEQPLTPG